MYYPTVCTSFIYSKTFVHDVQIESEGSLSLVRSFGQSKIVLAATSAIWLMCWFGPSRLPKT